MQITSRQYGFINKALAAITIGFGLYLAVAPIIPEISFKLQHSEFRQWLVQHGLWRQQKQTTLSVTQTATTTNTATLAMPLETPEENTLVIPSIDINTPILEGLSGKVLEQGAWRRPKTSTPELGGNTVLVGHRFLYTSGTRTFYHLDKLKIGDEIIVYWQKQKYTYIIDSVTVTSPSAIEIEAPTKQAILTLYTCTPLFSINKRLVVRALLQN